MISTDLKIRRDNSERVSVRLVKAFCLAVSRLLWRIEYSGLENIPQKDTRGLVIVSNHQTYIDPVWIGIPIRRDLKFLAWDKALHWPVIGAIMKWLGSLPINTSTGRNPESMRRAVEYLRRGSAVMIFPEGARAFEDGRPLEFKGGGATIASEAEVPILPVSVVGANRIWPRGWKWPKLGKVRIVFHPLIPCPSLTIGDRKTVIQETTQKIKSIVSSSL